MSEKFNQLNPEQKQKLTQFLDVREESGRSALFLAAEANRVKCADVLIRYKASTEVCNHKNITPLGVACDQGHASMILLLIERGANVNVKVGDKNLVECVKTSIKAPREKCEVIKALLANGCVVNDAALKEIRDSLPAETTSHWDECVRVALAARAKNFSRAVADVAPLPADDSAQAPMDTISKFLGFENSLQ